MDEAIEELTYSLLQGGPPVRKRGAYHPPPQRDLMLVFDRNGGNKIRCDMKKRLDLDVENGIIHPATTSVENTIMLILNVQ